MKNKPNAPGGDAQVVSGPIVGQDLNRQARPVMTQNWNNRSILQNTMGTMGRDRSPLNDKGNCSEIVKSKNFFSRSKKNPFLFQVRDEDRWGSGNNMPNNGNNFQPTPTQTFNDRNDCEIIVVNKALTYENFRFSISIFDDITNNPIRLQSIC